MVEIKVPLLPIECGECRSRVFTRTEEGTYVDVVTLVGGEMRVGSRHDEMDVATPWVCENGHEQES